MNAPPHPSTGLPGTLSDAAFRLAYRIAFRLLLAWWFLRRPAHRGATVAVWVGGEVLLLHQSYRATLDFPGGSIGRGELPREAACRELGEEVGLAVPPEALSHARDIAGWWEHRHDHVSIFELRLSGRPTLRLDNREIVAASFMTPATALSLPLAPYIRAYLEAVGVP